MNNLARDREALILEYTSLVKIIAFRLAIRLPPHIEVNDLISAGIIGLIEAIDRFDAKRGVKMETYLSFRIKGIMLDELRKMDWIPRSTRRKAKQLEQEYSRVEIKLGRQPTEEEMAQAFGMQVEKFRKFLREVSSMAVLSLEDLGFSRDGRGRKIMEYLADPNGDDPIARLNLKEMRSFLSGAIDELSERERLVLSLYYYEDLNLKEIGKVLGVTESRVCQLHTQAIFRLKAKLKQGQKVKFP